MSNDLKSKLTNVMSTIFGIEASVLGDNPSISSVKEWDSLKHMYLIVALEEEFETTFSEDEISSFTNFNDILDCLSSKK